MNWKIKQKAFKKIIRAFMEKHSALNKNVKYMLVTDSKQSCAPTSDIKTILNRMWACDREKLYVFHNDKTFGWVFLVYENGPEYFISDYTTNLSTSLSKALGLAASYE